MKIAFFIHNIFNTGGTERVTTTLANGLCRREHEVIIISEQFGEELKFNVDKSINVINLNSQKYKNSILRKLIIYKKLKNIIINQNINVLICVDVTLYLYAFRLRKYARIIAWEHFNYYYNLGQKVRTFARKFAARYADALVVLSKNDYDSYRKEVKLIKKLEYIYNPLPFNIERRSVLNNKRILSVGRYENQKGFDLLLKSWKMIMNDLPDWDLRIVGDGKEKDNLEDIIIKNNLKRVKLVPFTKNIVNEYSMADIFVLSSRFEGFGMVILEAQACGLPVAAFDCPYGPSELIANNENGLLIENGNVNLLGNAMRELANDKEKIETLSAKALRNAERFNLSKIVEEWERLFKVL